MLQLFNEIQSLDGEADGYISPNELRVLLQRLNIHFTAKRFEDAFSLFDTNADGKINLMEFHAFIFPSDATEVLHTGVMSLSVAWFTNCDVEQINRLKRLKKFEVSMPNGTPHQALENSSPKRRTGLLSSVNIAQ